MSEMVDRVAKELFLWQEGKSDWDTAEAESKEDAREAARAAIKAMREPTREMLRAVMTFEPASPYRDLPWAWTDMIDEALKETVKAHDPRISNDPEEKIETENPALIAAEMARQAFPDREMEWEEVARQADFCDQPVNNQENSCKKQSQ